MKILLITDAWTPQTNGVVTTLSHVCEVWAAQGHQVQVIHPGQFRTWSLWGYPEIRVCWPNLSQLTQQIDEFAPEVMHIATEGPLGFRARQYALKRGAPFTTSFHTLFAEYLHARIPLIPLSWGYAYLRWFHRPATQTLVTTATIEENLAQRGFAHLTLWSRGIDFSVFHPLGTPQAEHAPKTPILLYVGRVAVEKNIPAFLECACPGEKWVVGDGPELESYRKKYPRVKFLGQKKGAELADCYRRADVMVFPSRTDTFGLVMIESMACGTPVAAFPVQGPVDVVKQGVNGILDPDLAEAIEGALQLNREQVAASVRHMTWQASAQVLLSSMQRQIA